MLPIATRHRQVKQILYQLSGFSLKNVGINRTKSKLEKYYFTDKVSTYLCDQVGKFGVTRYSLQTRGKSQLEVGIGYVTVSIYTTTFPHTRSFSVVRPSSEVGTEIRASPSPLYPRTPLHVRCPQAAAVQFPLPACINFRLKLFHVVHFLLTFVMIFVILP